MTGELPEAGEVFKAMDKMGNQIEIERKDAWNVRWKVKEATEEVHPTMVLVKEGETLCRVLQKESGEVITFNETLYQMVNNHFVDGETEGTAKGPYKTPGNNDLLFWENESCIYAAAKMMKSANGKKLEILSHLEKITLTEDVE